MDEDERRTIIIEFIRVNQPCKAQKIVDGLSKQISRGQIFKILGDLQKEGIVKDEIKDEYKQNSRDHALVLVTDNPLIVIPNEIEKFEQAYFPSLLKTRDLIAEKLNKSEIDPFEPPFKAMSDILLFFYEVMKVYMLRSTIVWPKVIRNRDTLKRLNSIIFTKFADMQTRISEILDSTVGFERSRIGFYASELHETEDFVQTLVGGRVSDLISEIIRTEMARQKIYSESSVYKWDLDFSDKGVEELARKMRQQNPGRTELELNYSEMFDSYIRKK